MPGDINAMPSHAPHSSRLPSIPPQHPEQENTADLVNAACADWTAVPAQSRAWKKLQKLVNASNAEQLDFVSGYVREGYSDINFELRNGACQSLATEFFLHDFNLLNPYDGIAYRALLVEKGGYETLATIGETVADDSVQTASTLLVNGRDWFNHACRCETRKDLHKVLLIFDKSVPKKNMSTGYLPDHVAIPPNVVASVVYAREHDDVLVVGLAYAGDQGASHDVKSMFDGLSKSALPIPLLPGI